MKSCPTCNRIYGDAMHFCLDDGTPLLSDDASLAESGATIKIPAARLTNQGPTEVLSGELTAPAARSPQPTQRYDSPQLNPPSQRKQNALPWILGAALVLGLSAIAVAWIVTRDNEQAKSLAAQNPVESENSSQTADPSLEAPTVIRNAEELPRRIETRKEMVEIPSEQPVPVVVTPPEPERITVPTPTKPRAPISGGVLNGRAVTLPKPAYPAIAKAARASGTVTVQVTLDESGKVISARAVSGHPLLQASAVQAAYGARFAPTLLSGQPVKVIGVLVYNFVAP